MFFFLPPQDGVNRSGKTQAQGQPPTIPGQGGEQSKLKHNFSSSPPIFQDDSGSLQKNYEFPSTATPRWKFWFWAQDSVIFAATASPAPTAGQKEATGKGLTKKVIKLVKLLHLNGTILGKERVNITPASPYFMSELHTNRRPHQENKLQGPGPETATEAQQQVIKHTSSPSWCFRCPARGRALAEDLLFLPAAVCACPDTPALHRSVQNQQRQEKPSSTLGPHSQQPQSCPSARGGLWDLTNSLVLFKSISKTREHQGSDAE